MRSCFVLTKEVFLCLDSSLCDWFDMHHSLLALGLIMPSLILGYFTKYHPNTKTLKGTIL